MEGRRWIDLALELADEGTAASVLARINRASAIVANAFAQGEIELTSSKKALALYRELDDRFGMARSQAHFCNALMRLGRGEEAEPMLLETLTQLRQLGALACSQR